MKAAGVLFLTPQRTALFLKRGPGGDHPGEWCTPGGRTEGDETAEQTAVRETLEEIGLVPDGVRALLARTVMPAGLPPPAAPAPPAEGQALPIEAGGAVIDQGAPTEVDFTTFLQLVKEEFVPTLCDEHTAWCWASLDTPPEPLHPGVRISTARLTMDELGVARAMAAGELTSPQRYQNVTLFAIRITGTGVSFRSRGDEFVFRDPAMYLNEEFLARCNGLAVIMEHPAEATLDSNEYSDRNVGAIMLPFIKGDEVWGIAKIYDDAAIEMMSSDQMSTSPCVVIRNADSTKLTHEDGRKLLVEGKPKLLDHIAICPRGVWDKGGEPSGVSVIIDSEPQPGEATMADEPEDKTEDKKADAEQSGIDKVLAAVDSISKRMDSYDEARKADAARADAAKADAEGDKGDDKKDDAEDDKKDPPFEKKADAEDDEKKADAAPGDGISPALRAELDKLSRAIPRNPSDAEFAVMSSVQAKADRVFQAFGDSAPRPLQGEDANAYRRRLASDLKAHSAALKGVNLMAIHDSVAFDHLESQIYADAMHAALHPADVAAGQLRQVQSTDRTGRVITSFVGDPASWLEDFAGTRRALTGVNNGVH